MTGLQQSLQRACLTLRLQIDFDKTVIIEKDLSIRADAYLPYLGAPMGILIFTDVSKVWPYRANIRAAKYAYSVLGERELDSELNEELFKNMFRDWGWSGKLEQKPIWMA